MIFPSSPASWGVIVTCLVPFPPFSRFVSLNFVVSETRSISPESWSISAWIASRSVCEFVPFAACVASSSIRWSMSCTSPSAPSAVCTEETPSCAFVEPRSRPRICRRIFSEMERPAASSAPRLILYPDESFSVDFFCLVSWMPSIRDVFIAMMLCATTMLHPSVQVNCKNAEMPFSQLCRKPFRIGLQHN